MAGQSKLWSVKNYHEQKLFVLRLCFCIRREVGVDKVGDITIQITGPCVKLSTSCRFARNNVFLNVLAVVERPWR